MKYYAFKQSKSLVAIAAKEVASREEFMSFCIANRIYEDYCLPEDADMTNDERKAIEDFHTLERNCSNG